MGFVGSKGIVVAVVRDVTEQRDLQDKLASLATTDGLTGLANRSTFDERLAEEWARARRDGTQLSLLLINLDHFKAFNDHYGHLAGDGCLRALGRILSAEPSARPTSRHATAARNSPCCCRTPMRKVAPGSAKRFARRCTTSPCCMPKIRPHGWSLRASAPRRGSHPNHHGR